MKKIVIFIKFSLLSSTILLIQNYTFSQISKEPVNLNKSQPSKTIVSEKKMSLSKEKMSLNEVLEELNKKYQLNFILDATTSDDGLRTVQMIPLSTSEMMQMIANTFYRKMVFVQGTYVMRSSEWKDNLPLQLEGTQTSGVPEIVNWKEDNRILVERNDPPENPDFPLPAKDISVRVTNMSLKNVLYQMEKKTLWSVRSDGRLKEKKISIFVSRISPGKLLEDIGSLLNAGPQVTIAPTKLNLVFLEDSLDNLPEDWKKRKRMSDKLRPELEKMLSDLDKKTIDGGDFVAIPLSKMNKGLQDKVLDYLKQSYQLSGAKNGFPSPNMSRLQDFAIRFQPERSGIAYRAFGAMTIGPDGSEYYY
jgi:hypothetical protein